MSLLAFAADAAIQRCAEARAGGSAQAVSSPEILISWFLSHVQKPEFQILPWVQFSAGTRRGFTPDPRSDAGSVWSQMHMATAPPSAYQEDAYQLKEVR